MAKTKIPTIVAIVFLVVGLAAGVFLVQRQQEFRLSASPDRAPKDLRITNVTDKSFVVSWYTDVNSAGFLEYGNTPNLGEVVLQEDIEPKRVHYIKVENLRPETNYYFVINSGGDRYDNSGIPWSVKTGPVLETNREAMAISGQVSSKLDTPAGNIVLYLQIGGAQPISALTSENGSFVVPLSNIRNNSLERFIKINPEETLIDLTFQGGPLGTAFVRANPRDLMPSPQIYLGESQDLRNNRNNSIKGTLPEAEIKLPNEADSRPQFEVD